MKSLAGDARLSVPQLYHDEVIATPEIVTQTTHHPAIRYDVVVWEYLRDGYCAVLALVDFAGRTGVTNERVLSRCGWSPFDGVKFQAWMPAPL